MFWDSSAIVPTLVPEARSAAMVALLEAEPVLVAWWATPVECQSALYRRQREGGVPRAIVEQALQRLRGLVEDADFVAPSSRLRDRAGRLLASHPLRAADALQLAAALVWCDDRPEGEPFVCLDERLRDAALREGFALLPA
jgi:hypothetical protein